VPFFKFLVRLTNVVRYENAQDISSMTMNEFVHASQIGYLRQNHLHEL
jgi:hypothetical protein